MSKTICNAQSFFFIFFASFLSPQLFAPSFIDVLRFSCSLLEKSSNVIIRVGDGLGLGGDSLEPEVSEREFESKYFLVSCGAKYYFEYCVKGRDDYKKTFFKLAKKFGPWRFDAEKAWLQAFSEHGIEKLEKDERVDAHVMAFISLMVIEGHFWDRGNTNESSNRNVVKAVVKRLLEGNFVCWGGCLITIPPRKEWSVALAEEHLSSRYYRPSDQGVSD